MPFVRGRMLPEIESTGNAKRSFDVLLWLTQRSRQTLRDLDEIDVLRLYLRNLRPIVCTIEFLVPASHTETIARLRTLNIGFKIIEAVQPSEQTIRIPEEAQLEQATKLALACDADTLVVTEHHWFPYIPDLEEVGILLSDTHVLKRQCELFARGHDLPWAFEYPIWNMKWTGFYQLCENSALKDGLELLDAAQKKNVNVEAQEAGRTLIHNRLPNILFTRDRLLFYDIQKLSAVRNKWKRQHFDFESAYYFNFYYPLLWGAFDHIALFVNNFLGLGVKEIEVGANRKKFLAALLEKNAALYTIFTDTKHVSFMNRIGSLRHYASHRGSVQPTKLIEMPDKELTNDEVDAMIAEAQMDDILAFMPKGETRNRLQEMMRFNFRMQHYENIGTIADGMVEMELEGKRVLIRPSSDIGWNYQRFMQFLGDVLAELTKTLQT